MCTEEQILISNNQLVNMNYRIIYVLIVTNSSSQFEPFVNYSFQIALAITKLNLKNERHLLQGLKLAVICNHTQKNYIKNKQGHAQQMKTH